MMLSSNSARVRGLVRFLQRQFLQEGELPFTDVLTLKTISQALTSAEVVWNDCIYTPLLTLWVFLRQVLSDDHSCRDAVARLITHRLSRGQSSCSKETSAYCQAKKRLPEKFFSEIAREIGQKLDKSGRSDWLWKGRRVYMYDGSTVSMPDTDKNQKAYPQHDSQQPGLGFPLARIGAIFSLSCGAIVDLRRWNVELDLRNVKQTLQMDILRCKTPELVRKEIWTHILAYNLIRTIMARSEEVV